MEKEPVVDLLTLKCSYNHQDAMFVVGWLMSEAPAEVLEGALLALHARQKATGRYDVEAAAAERWGPRPGSRT
jgi:hypothetical protein